MSVTFTQDGMAITLPRKGLGSYGLLARNTLQGFINRKARQGVESLRVIRVTHQNDPRSISVYFTAIRGSLMEMGTYGGPGR
jgi:hypothetical protein